MSVASLFFGAFIFFVWPGCSHVPMLARHRRVRRASPTRLPHSRASVALDCVAASLRQLFSLKRL